MPATPNILLQNAAQAKAQAASAKSSAMAADAGDKATSFAKVFADQGSNKPAVSADNSVKSARDKVADTGGKKDAGTDQSAAPEPAKDWIAVAIGLAIWGAMLFALHDWLIGMPLL